VNACRLDKAAPLVKKPKLAKELEKLRKDVRGKAQVLAERTLPECLKLAKDVTTLVARRVQLQARLRHGYGCACAA
jgi:hypothetical protein